MRDFRKLKIWKLGMDIVVDVYQLSAELPKDEKFGLKSQIQRCSVSIPSNIAEGCSRNSQIDYKRFLEYAIGSAFELETQLLLIQRLNLIDSDELLSETLDKITREQKMLNTLITKIKTES